MRVRPTLGDLLATAHQTAAEVRTMDDYDRAQTIVAPEVAIATQRFGHDLMVRRPAEYFRTEVWRLARH